MKKSPTKKPTNKKITKPRRTSIRDYQPDENPPDWQASAEVMEKWVNKKLDDIYDLNALQIIENDLISDEMREAYNGNIEPLRNKYPELARFLHIAPRETITTDNYYESIAEEMLYEIGYFPQREGKTSEEEPRPIRIKAALRDVEWIKLIWQKYYGNKKRQNLIKAEEIAARRWKVKQETLRNSMKKSKPSNISPPR